MCLWKKNEYVFHNDELKMQEIEGFIAAVFSIVGLLLDPTTCANVFLNSEQTILIYRRKMCIGPRFTWILPQKEFSGLVVSEDQQGEG